MKSNLIPALLVGFIFANCSKENSQNAVEASVNIDNIVVTDTVKVPLIDLGKRTYLGFKGGLYPNGANLASGKYAKDLLSFARNIIPKDTSGKSSATGVVGFISLGGSTTGNLMNALLAKTVGNPVTNPSLFMLNCANGKHTGSINNMINPADPYWTYVNNRLTSAKLSYKQVQVVYLETEDSFYTTTFPDRAFRARDEYESALRLFKTKFPQLKLVYVLGRTTTFNVDNVTNSEPCPYYNGWACKFVIEDQINGVAGTVYKGQSAVAPMITWGWYEWANGTNVPRSDGFTWQESNTVDGLHANDAGEDTLSSRFQNFLLTDSAAKTWYGKKP